jgi:hypothetical protein
LKIGPPLREQADGAGDRGQVVADLLAAAARQQRDHRARRVQAVGSEEFRAVMPHGHQVHERMPDESDRHARLLVEAGLEREDDDHVRDVGSNRPEASPAPGPDLRRDVVDDGDPPGVQCPCEPQIEIGVVHQDRDVGALAIDLGEQRAEDPAEVLQVGDHFPQADDREIADVGEERRALGGEALAAKAENPRRIVRHQGTDVAHEVGGVEVAGRLTTRYEEPRHRRAV